MYVRLSVRLSVCLSVCRPASRRNSLTGLVYVIISFLKLGLNKKPELKFANLAFTSLLCMASALPLGEVVLIRQTFVWSLPFNWCSVPGALVVSMRWWLHLVAGGIQVKIQVKYRFLIGFQINCWVCDQIRLTMTSTAVQAYNWSMIINLYSA